jgi:hypothetical protein
MMDKAQEKKTVSMSHTTSSKPYRVEQKVRLSYTAVAVHVSALAPRFLVFSRTVDGYETICNTQTPAAN